jgi:ataxia telangiectasia mutated family protein
LYFFICAGYLQSFCFQLYQLSESFHSTVTPGSSRPHAKRTKLENPISALLHSIHTQPSSNARCYHLQTLLFFIERYWSLIHHSFKEEVINVLLQHVTSDDGVVQSWIFLNFAAIAYSEGFATARKPSPNKIDSPMLTSTIWDPIWTHAIRRANVPTVCRSACHAGHTFLVSLYNQTDLSRILLTSHHVLLEIETLAKDMDVQGPAYPYDSVCMFLSQCLSIASQDVRLYRMQLEDKVLSWLIDSWKMSGTERTKVSLHGVRDIFILLETVCGLSKRVDLPVHLSLPTCQIVDSVIEEHEGKVIRDFLLYAKLPSFQQKPNAGRSATNNQAASLTDLQLLAPRGRERRISAFFLKSLESLISEWEVLQENVTAEISRRTLDLAVAAITFETLLMFNGTMSNRQVLQKAAKVISMVTPLLNENRWTVAEKSLVLSALENVVHHTGHSHSRRNWETLSWPGTKSGIQEEILSSLTPDGISCRGAYSTQRISFLRLIWQNAEVNHHMSFFILRIDLPIFRFKRLLNPLYPFCGRYFVGFLWTNPASPVHIRQQMLTIKMDLGLFELHPLMAHLERYRRWRTVNRLNSYSKYVSVLLPVVHSYSLPLESQPVTKS